MKIDSSLLQLYLVTDRRWLKGRKLEDVVEEALKAGVTLVQYREKGVPPHTNTSIYNDSNCNITSTAADVTTAGETEREYLTPDEKLVQAKKLVAVCHKYNVPLLIDDDVELAVNSGADGVHVGQDDMAIQTARKMLGDGKIIGATAHNVEEAVKAEKDGADYLGCGAAFGSDTKKDAKAIDIHSYKKITSAVNIPVCAIGGINRRNIGELDGGGLSGIAVISGILAEDDIEAVCRELLAASRKLH